MMWSVHPCSDLLVLHQDRYPTASNDEGTLHRLGKNYFQSLGQFEQEEIEKSHCKPSSLVWDLNPSLRSSPSFTSNQEQVPCMSQIKE